MQYLSIRKFFLDYLIGSGLVFVFLLLAIGNTTVIDMKSTILLNHKCSLPFPENEVLDEVSRVLKEGEMCKVISPCDGKQSIQCNGTVEIYELPQTLFMLGSLTHRVKDSVIDTYGLDNYGDESDLKISRASFVLFMIYSLVLTESGALIFALWRQKALRKVLALPIGSKYDQILKPALFGLIFAMMIIAVNLSLFNLFDYAGSEQSAVMKRFFQTLPGIAFVVLLAPVLEELMFRGVLFRFFIDRNRLISGALIVSLVFSMLHGFREETLAWQLYMSSTYFLGSLFLCRLYITQKNLWSPIVFHSAYNSTMLLAFNMLI